MRKCQDSWSSSRGNAEAAIGVVETAKELEDEYQVTDQAKKAASKAIGQLQKKIKESL